jgi:putative transposase
VGRAQAKELRAHLFALVERLTREGPQGEARDEAPAADVAHLCRIAGLSRASYYRWLAPKATRRDDAILSDLIQRLALKRRFEGYRRIAKRLREEGLIVNKKRVLRLMRRDNLLSLRQRPFVPATTMSRHPFTIVPNLARGLVPTGLDQLWVADITYVRLAEAFVYLAVVVDAFSRKVVGWTLDDHLEARLALAALDQAIEARDPPAGLIHHSDRGVQYASSDYAARLAERGFEASMSRPGNPYDNAKAESFMKTLKAEEADGKAYLDLDDARRQIGAFIEEIYNADRLHSALGYASPIAFEKDFKEAERRKQETLTALSPN